MLHENVGTIEDQLAAIEHEITERDGVKPQLTLGVQIRKSSGQMGSARRKPCPAAEFIEAESDIAAELGPGQYYLVVRQVGKTGSVGKLEWDVDGVAAPVVPQPSQPEALPMASGLGGGVDMGTMLITMMQTTAQQQIAAQQAQAQQQTAMMQGFLSLATAMANKPEREQRPLSEIWEAVEMIESRRGDGGGGDGEAVNAMLRALPAFLDKMPSQTAPAPTPTPAGETPPPPQLTREGIVGEYVRRSWPGVPGEAADVIADRVVTAGRIVAARESEGSPPRDAAEFVADFIGHEFASQLVGNLDRVPVLIRLGDSRVSEDYAGSVSAELPAVLNDDDDAEHGEEGTNDEAAPAE